MNESKYLTSREICLTHLGASGALPKLEESLWNLLHKGHDFCTIKSTLLDTISDQAEAIYFTYQQDLERNKNFNSHIHTSFSVQQQEESL